MQVRRATMRDMMDMQQCNLRCLPENYHLRYYHYHICSHPELLYVCEDVNGIICGYVLGKIDEEDDPKKKHGHITSLSVLRSHRKLGVASKVMNATHRDMRDIYGGHFSSLHVRRTNVAGRNLYQEALGYRVHEVDAKYYLDDEDAFHMKRYFAPTGIERVGYVEKNGEITWSKLRDSPKMQAFLSQAGYTFPAGDAGDHNTAPGTPAPGASANVKETAGDRPPTAAASSGSAGKGAAAAAGGATGGKAGAAGGGAGKKGQSHIKNDDVAAAYAELQKDLQDGNSKGDGNAGSGKGGKGGKKGGK